MITMIRVLVNVCGSQAAAPENARVNRICRGEAVPSAICSGRVYRSFSNQESPMRKTILLAVIACVLGIVLLAALAFYIPGRLRTVPDDSQSEVFTGFHISTESMKPSSTASGLKKQTSSSGTEQGARNAAVPAETVSDETAPDETLPDGGIGPAQGRQQAAQRPGDSSEPAQRSGELPPKAGPHRIIWVGDSRTLGMLDALRRAKQEDEDFFVGKVGEGVHWFQEEGMSELTDVIEDHPDLPVVLNLGVNDPQLVDEYVTAYWDVIRACPDTHFYILSVNPLDEEFLIEDGQVAEQVFDDINSLNVAKMNVKLKEEFGSRYIDSASYLKSDGFDTVDGLHFSTQTYLKIHSFVVNQLF